jgi:hypothetical protein
MASVSVNSLHLILPFKPAADIKVLVKIPMLKAVTIQMPQWNLFRS